MTSDSALNDRPGLIVRWGHAPTSARQTILALAKKCPAAISPDNRTVGACPHRRATNHPRPREKNGPAAISPDNRTVGACPTSTRQTILALAKKCPAAISPDNRTVGACPHRRATNHPRPREKNGPAAISPDNRTVGACPTSTRQTILDLAKRCPAAISPDNRTVGACPHLRATNHRQKNSTIRTTTTQKTFYLISSSPKN